jgi:hypothetical protein
MTIDHTITAIKPAAARAYGNAKREVEEAHGKSTLRLIGPRLHRALIAERLLTHLTHQDESVNPARLIAIANATWTLLCEDEEVYL